MFSFRGEEDRFPFAMFLEHQDPELGKKLTGDVCERVMDRSIRAIDCLSGRDEDFMTWDMQAERDPWWAGIKPRWKGGCFIEDPLTDEHLFETAGSLLYIQQQFDWYQCTEINEEDAQDAADMEAFLNDIIVENKVNTVHLYDLLCMMGRHSYGVMYCGWKQQYGKQYTPKARHKENQRIFNLDDPEVMQNPQDYDTTEEIMETVLRDGLDCRVPYTGDVYFDSPQAQSFDQAARVIERFHWTEDDLLNSIEDFGCDAKEIKSILQAEPTSSTRTFFSEYNEREGISGNDTWEVFMVMGSLPALLDNGISKLKDSERRRDYVWMICPAAQSVFKFSKSPFQKRPYVKFPLRGVPQRMIGHSICNMMAPLQREATLAYRFRVDFRDVYMSSPIIVPAALYNEWTSFKAYPGAAYPVDAPYTPDHFKPLPYNPAGYQAGIADWKDTIARADQYVSADAKGTSVQGETAMAVSNRAAGADEKTDLFLTNLHFGVEDLGEVILSHYQQFTGSDGMTKRIGGKTVNISSEMLRKRFRISATGSSEGANPVLKANKAMAVAKYAMSDPILQEKYQQGDKTGMFFINNYVYRALGIRNPQVIDGREPTSPPNSDYILEALMQIVQQYAQQNDPAAIQIMTAMQQLMAQSQQQGGQPSQPGQPQHGAQGGPKVSMSVNFKDLAPNEKDAMATQMLGLPPYQGAPGKTDAGRSGQVVHTLRPTGLNGSGPGGPMVAGGR